MPLLSERSAIKPPLDQLPEIPLGQHAAWMGNTGEGKSISAMLELLSVPDAIIVNTKGDPDFEKIGVNVGDRWSTDTKWDDYILDVGNGRYNYCPSDTWMKSRAYQERFYERMLRVGNRIIYHDEYDDICENAQSFPWWFKKCFKQGRWQHLSMWGSGQELVRIPSFTLGQCKYVFLHYIGWEPYRKMAEGWLQRKIDWSLIPELSHKFIIKTPQGLHGPQPPLDISSLRRK